MEINKVKKILYKEKPIAYSQYTIHGSEQEMIKCYKAESSIGEHRFIINRKDMGEKEFEDELPAQLLIKWLIC